MSSLSNFRKKSSKPEEDSAQQGMQPKGSAIALSFPQAFSQSTPHSADKGKTAFIKLNDEKSCQNCGGKLASLGLGKGPHAASLRCAACGKFIKWLSRKLLAEMKGGQAHE